MYDTSDCALSLFFVQQYIVAMTSQLLTEIQESPLAPLASVLPLDHCTDALMENELVIMSEYLLF